MANQAVTTDMTLAAVIALGLLDGENITINNGAVVTQTQTNTVLIGRITTNEGVFHQDGLNISAGNSITLVGEGGNASVDETMMSSSSR